MHCDSISIERMTKWSCTSRISSTDCSQCILSIYLMTTWFYHLLAYPSSSMRLCSVWEKNFIDFEKSFFIIHKQIQQVVSILVRKLINFDSILSKLCKFQKALFKFTGIFCTFINLLEFLFIHNFIFQSSLHNIFSYFLNTFYE